MLVDTESSVTGTRVQHGMLLRFHSPEPHELHVPFSRYLPPSNVMLMMHKANFQVVTATSGV